MKPVFALTLSLATLVSATALAAPERVRGTISAVSGDGITLSTGNGEVTIHQDANTKYLKVVKASLDRVAQDSFIGTATKEVGGKLIALEVVVFPPAMKGTGEGHYAWDRIQDTTTAGGSSATSSMMTNGTVSAVQASGATANSTMTNGTVSATDAKGGVKQITVGYKNPKDGTMGQQVILVPPTAPIVAFEPDSLSDVSVGKVVFIVANSDAGRLTANVVAIGTEGAPPPM
ncbi:MAG: hypothetical protein M3N26_05365 [Pseudomonadota bacterium]|nr:hypothetical protein [Pseudomonadota bacterium]